MKNPSRITHIIVSRDGDLRFTLPSHASYAYSPMDLNLIEFSKVTYRFALKDDSGNISRFSPPHSIYVP